MASHDPTYECPGPRRTGVGERAARLPSPYDPVLMTPDFATLTELRFEAPGRFGANVPDGWQQGRGAFGGLLIALLVRAISQHEGDDERTLRVLTAELCAPALVGSVEIRTETLRRGSNVTTTTARLLQGEQILAHAVGVLARQRQDDRRWVGPAPPAPPDWRSVPPMALPPVFAPVFTRWFEFRPDGPSPFSGAASPMASGWIRLKQPGPVRDAAEVAALVDAWWPAHFATDDAPRPIATISFTLDFVADAAIVDRDAPLYHRGTLVAARHGYLVEQRELWSPEGELLAINTQTIALISPSLKRGSIRAGARSAPH